MTAERRQLKVVFVMSRILGNNTYAQRIKEVVEKYSSELGVEPYFLDFLDEDYGRYTHPVNRVIGAFLSSFTAREKFADAIRDIGPDVLFFNVWELFPAFYPEIRKVYTILAHDTTTMCHFELDSLNHVPTLVERLRTNFMAAIHKAIVSKVDFFLPMSSWARRSLIRDFDVEDDHVEVNCPLVDVDVWSEGESFGGEGKPVLLFVGNDFDRKGGKFLLELYSTRLSERFVLKIVSNDPTLKSVAFPLGVELIQGITQSELGRLINIYQSAFLLLHPTRRDWSSFAIVEAAATGLPSISTEVGGISDLMEPGVSGVLLPLSASIDEWALRIEHLLNHPNEYLLMRSAARKRAVERFSYFCMRDSLKRALAALQF